MRDMGVGMGSGRQIAVNGVVLHAEVRDAEPGMAADETPLVLLHGFTGSAAGWGAHLDALARRGLRVIALDMLGHGGSAAPADPRRYALEQCRDDILGALGILDVRAGEAVLLGYSMGGRIALYTALTGFFRGLILESASAGLASASERTQRRASDAALAARIEHEGVAAFVDEWERLPLFASQAALPTERRDALRAQRLQNRALGLAQSLRGVGIGTQPPLYDALSTLHTETLLIAGALDPKFTALARQMAERLPHARLVVVPDAGHAVHLEQPDAFDSLVVAFCMSRCVADVTRTDHN